MNYEDLAFKPAMTWEELCEWAKSKGLEVYKSPYDDFERIRYARLCCFKNGSMTFANEIFAENRTYEQMKNIIDNLYGEE